MTSWRSTTDQTSCLLWLDLLMAPRCRSSCSAAPTFSTCSSPLITADQTPASKYYMKVGITYHHPLTAQRDGSWWDANLLSSGVTVDSYSCLDPGIPVNGIRYGQDFSIGSTVSFGCDSGYRLSHEEPLVCEKNHWWSHPLPTCDGKSS